MISVILEIATAKVSENTYVNHSHTVHLLPNTIFCYVRTPSFPISILLLFLVYPRNYYAQPIHAVHPTRPLYGAESPLTSCTHESNCLLTCCVCDRCMISVGKQSKVLHLRISHCLVL